MSVAAASEFILRPATRDDAAVIQRLIIELAIATGMEDKVTSTPQDILEQGFGAAPAFRVLLAERGGEAVGMALYFFIWSSWRGESGVYLQDLVVMPTARGTGLGRRLLAATARAARASGATHLRLSVDRSNKDAMRFYETCGMTESRDERILQIDGGALAALGDAS